MGRIDREIITVRAMIGLYCELNHNTKDELCDDCGRLNSYAHEKLVQCPFGESKTVCTKCPVHCYDKEMRDRIRKVMRFAGPRMLLHHPILTIFHMINKKKSSSGK